MSEKISVCIYFDEKPENIDRFINFFWNSKYQIRVFHSKRGNIFQEMISEFLTNFTEKTSYFINGKSILTSSLPELENAVENFLSRKSESVLLLETQGIDCCFSPDLKLDSKHVFLPVKNFDSFFGFFTTREFLESFFRRGKNFEKTLQTEIQSGKVKSLLLYPFPISRSSNLLCKSSSQKSSGIDKNSFFLLLFIFLLLTFIYWIYARENRKKKE